MISLRAASNYISLFHLLNFTPIGMGVAHLSLTIVKKCLHISILIEITEKDYRPAMVLKPFS